MAKETEKRLIKTLEFLKEPHGSTIPTIVKAMNGDDGPQVSLKKIVQTLRGCLENGILKVSEGRVKFKQMDLTEGEDQRPQQHEEQGGRGGGAKVGCASRGVCSSRMPKSSSKQKCSKSKSLRPFPKPCSLGTTVTNAISNSKICVADGEPPEGGGEGGGNGGEGGEPPECPKPKPKCRKPKPKCKKKPKCPKPKPKCPKPKPKCPKPKPKCTKSKPKCPKPKTCARRKTQCYSKRKKKLSGEGGADGSSESVKNRNCQNPQGKDNPTFDRF